MIQTGPIGATILFVGIMVVREVWQGLKWVLKH